eukprot:m.9411 g.9411  ORF g.9411 m.9411 type:complete len:140 (-) comp6343_c0_seq2:309-728(-)
MPLTCFILDIALSHLKNAVGDIIHLVQDALLQLQTEYDLQLVSTSSASNNSTWDESTTLEKELQVAEEENNKQLSRSPRQPVLLRDTAPSPTPQSLLRTALRRSSKFHRKSFVEKSLPKQQGNGEEDKVDDELFAFLFF